MLSFSVDEFANALGLGYYFLVYGVGAIAMALSIMAFQLKHRVSIILCNAFGQTCWVAHFLLQGDVTSAIACALSALMLAVFSKKDKWKWSTSPYSIAAFIIILSGCSLLSFENWKNIFPLLAGIFAVIANSRASEKRLRQFSILWCLFWLLNSISNHYWIALVNDLLCTISTVVALVRYREKKGNEKNEIEAVDSSST